MSISKQINVNDGSGKEFETVTTSELTFDLIPEVGSFNAVTSDGVARAISGSGEVPVINPGDDGKVLTVVDGAAAWDVAQGTEYTAGTGIAISNENVISCTVQGPTAGDGIAINNSGVVSVNSDNTLTAKDETVTATLPIGGDSDYTLERDGSADWYGYGNVFNISERTTLNGLQLTLAPGQWGAVSANPGEQVIFVFVNPGDSTKYAYTSTGYGWESGGEISLPLSATMGDVVYGGSATGISDVRDSEGNTLVYVSIATIEEGHGGDPNRVTPRVSASKEHYYYGPYYDDGTTSGYLYTLYFATAYTESPSITPNWDNIMTRYFGITLTSSTGNRKLSVTTPVAAISGSTDGKFLQSNGTATQWASVREVPTATNSEIGKVLGVTSGSPSTPNIGWVEQQGGTEYVAGNGIAITGDIVSVYHDSTLTGVGGTQYTDIVPDVGTSRVYANEGPGGSFAGWEYNAVAFEADATADEIRFALQPYDALQFNGEMFDEPNVKNKQVAAILVNPSDSTKWAITRVYSNGDIVYTDNGGHLANWDNANPKVFIVGTSPREDWMLGSGNVDEFSDLVSNGKVLVYLTASGSNDSFTPMYGSNDYYYYGPAYQGGKLYTTILATGNGGSGTDPVPPTTWDWRTTEGALQAVTGSGVSQLSVTNPVPSVDGQTGKFLKAGSNGPEWGTVSIPSYTAGDGIKIESNTVSAYHGETLVDKALPLAFKTGADSRTDWNPVFPQTVYTALKVEFGNIVPSNTILGVSIKSNSSSGASVAEPSRVTVDPDLGGKKVKLVFANPDNPSNYIEAVSAANVEVTQNYNSSYQYYYSNINLPAELFYSNFQSGFNWHGLTLADIQGADGSTLMYVAVCASDGTLVTTGSYGTTNNLWTVGFGVSSGDASTYALVTLPGNPVGFDVKTPVPDTRTAVAGSVLAIKSSGIGMEWVEGGVPTYTGRTIGTVYISTDNEVITSTADVTHIVVYENVKSAVVQWVVASTTTLPTINDGTNPLKASVNNPASLTVGRTVQVSILNGTWVCAEFA